MVIETIAANFTNNLTELMSFISSNVSNLTPGLMNYAYEAPKSSGINPDYIMSIIGGFALLIFGYVIKDEHKNKNRGICQKCGQESKLIKCADKKCEIRICEPCNFKDKNPILNLCMICSKYVCKEHYGVTHIHKGLNLLFHGVKATMDKPEVIKIEPQTLPIEYFGNNKEIAYAYEPNLSFSIRDNKEDKILFTNTLLKMKGEGYNYKGYGYEFFIFERQGNILSPPSILNDADEETMKTINNDLTNNSISRYVPIEKNRDYELPEESIKIEWEK